MRASVAVPRTLFVRGAVRSHTHLYVKDVVGIQFLVVNAINPKAADYGFEIIGGGISLEFINACLLQSEDRPYSFFEERLHAKSAELQEGDGS